MAIIINIIEMALTMNSRKKHHYLPRIIVQRMKLQRLMRERQAQRQRKLSEESRKQVTPTKNLRSRAIQIKTYIPKKKGIKKVDKINKPARQQIIKIQASEKDKKIDSPPKSKQKKSTGKVRSSSRLRNYQERKEKFQAVEKRLAKQYSKLSVTDATILKSSRRRSQRRPPSLTQLALMENKKQGKQSKKPEIKIEPTIKRARMPVQTARRSPPRSFSPSSQSQQTPKKVRRSKGKKVSNVKKEDIFVPKTKSQKPIKRQNENLRNKSINEIQRIQRIKKMLEERIFLLSVEKDEEKWSFKVVGRKGLEYSIELSQSLKCNCFDFRSKRMPCRHIHFIVVQIAHQQKIFEGITRGVIEEDARRELNQTLQKRLQHRLMEKKEKTANNQCLICFSEMNQDDEELYDCQDCQKCFHDDCIQKLGESSSTCPLCHSQLKNIAENPLLKFEELSI